MNVFPKSEKETNTHWMKLDRDSLLWDNFITMRVAEMMGKRPTNISIKWRSKNEDGYGVGSVIVNGKSAPGSTFRIPIIIKDYRLAPFDVILTETRKYPLNPETIDALLFSGSLGSQLAPEEVGNENSSGLNVQHIYGDSENGKMAMIKSLDGHVSLRDIDHAKQALLGMGSKSIIIDAIKNMIPKDEPIQIKKVEVISKEGPGDFNVFANENSPESMNMKAIKVDGSQLRKVLEAQLGSNPIMDAVMEAVEVNGDEGTALPWPQDDGEVEISSPVEDVKTSSTGFYTGVADTTGKEVNGLFIEKAVSILGEPRPEGIFISNKGGGLQGSNFSGKPFEGTVELPYGNRRPDFGEWGVFVFQSNNDLLAMGPISIMSKTEIESGRYSYVVKDECGQPITFTQSKSVQAINVDGTKVIIPENENVKWYRLPSAFKLTDRVSVHNSEKIDMLVENGRYYIRNLEDTLDSLKKAEAKFVLASHGMGISKMAQAFDMLGKHGHIYISGLKRFNPLDKQAEAPIIDLSRFDFIKMSAAFDKINTVDTVLSLNFLNNANVQKFVSSLPSLVEAREDLLGLLLASRLGETEISEDSVLQSIDALNEVIKGLKRLKFKSNVTN